ncbi:MAG: thiamine phosphate synthase [Acidobacteriaceae bacterium]
MLRCAITSGDGWAALAQARRWSSAGIEFVQLREKQLAPEELLRLASSTAAAVRESLRRSEHPSHSVTRLLLNGPAELAVRAGADGVHLTTRPDELTPAEVRRRFALLGAPPPIIGVSCHTLEQVRHADDGGADLILFGPVFEKQVKGVTAVAGVGLEPLREACAAAKTTPVLALGGVTWTNAPQCLQVGAAGVAGIRLFDDSTSPGSVRLRNYR